MRNRSFQKYYNKSIPTINSGLFCTENPNQSGLNPFLASGSKKARDAGAAPTTGLASPQLVAVLTPVHVSGTKWGKRSVSGKFRRAGTPSCRHAVMPQPCCLGASVPCRRAPCNRTVAPLPCHHAAIRRNSPQPPICRLVAPRNPPQLHCRHTIPRSRPPRCTISRSWPFH